MVLFLATGGEEMVDDMIDIKREADGAGEEATRTKASTSRRTPSVTATGMPA